MRAKFTTTLNPEIIKELKKRAIDEGVNVNDLIEKYVKDHRQKKGD